MSTPARGAAFFSEQRHLAARGGRPEAAAVEPGRLAPGAMVVETEAPAGDLEALLHQLGEFPGAAHARAEIRIVLAPAAHLAHDADDVLGALRIVGGEPFLEERLQLVRQAHD